MEQKQKKKTSKYTILDSVVLIGLIILLYLVFLLIFGGIERITKFGQTDDAAELTCVLRVEDIDSELYEIDPSATEECPFLHIGDSFYIDGTAVGEILSVEYENCMIPTDEKNGLGELIYVDDPSNMNILITVKLNGRETPEGYSIGETPLYVGDRLLFSTREFEREVLICSVGVYEEPDDLMPDAIPAGIDTDTD